jgi:drug/metabolite transporter superfamily protein YnfA
MVLTLFDWLAVFSSVEYTGRSLILIRGLVIVFSFKSGWLIIDALEKQDYQAMADDFVRVRLI